VKYAVVEDPGRLRRLIDAILAVASELSLSTLLQHLLEEGRDMTGAKYAALGLLDETRTHLEEFLTLGIDPDLEAMIGSRPTGEGILGLLILEPEPLRLDHLSDHPDSVGMPAHHPKMDSFLGVPILIHGEVYGNLYLTDKEGGFDEVDEATISTLTMAAGVAIENSRLHAKVRDASLEEDRLRIARDLHDSVTQQLFAAGLLLEATLKESRDPKVNARVETASSLLEESITQIRDVIYDLDSSRSHAELSKRIARVVEEFEDGLWINLAITGKLDDVSDRSLSASLLATLREALSNAIKHGKANRAQVSIEVTDNLTLSVCDDGVGIEDSKTSTQQGGRGLVNMASRASDLHGSMVVTVPEEGGTALVWSVPLHRGDQEHR
jgi:signal transduction histidine kinase